MHSDDLGATWNERADGAAIALPERHRRRAGARSGSCTADPHDRRASSGPAPSRTRCGAAPTAATSFELVPRALGPPAPAAVGRGLRRRRHPHGPAPTRRTRSRMLVAMSTGGVYRTARRRGDLGAAQHAASRPASCPTRSPSSASACTRSPATRQDAGAALRPEPPRGLPLRRRRRRPGSPSPTACPPTSGSPCSPTRAGRLALARAGRRRRRADPAGRPAAGAALRRRRRDLADRRPQGLPHPSYTCVLRDAAAVDTARRGRGLRRHPQRRRLRLGRRGRDVHPHRRAAARRAVRAGRRWCRDRPAGCGSSCPACCATTPAGVSELGVEVRRQRRRCAACSMPPRRPPAARRADARRDRGAAPARQRVRQRRGRPPRRAGWRRRWTPERWCTSFRRCPAASPDAAVAQGGGGRRCWGHEPLAVTPDARPPAPLQGRARAREAGPRARADRPRAP